MTDDELRTHLLLLGFRPLDTDNTWPRQYSLGKINLHFMDYLGGTPQAIDIHINYIYRKLEGYSEALDYIVKELSND